MNDPTTDTAVIRGYHAHVCYDDATKEAAGRLREALAAADG